MNHSKQILVTGGAGFIGSHLSEKLIEMGHRLVVVDDQSTGQSSNLKSIMDHPCLEWISGTIADKDLIREKVEWADEVYHLAAAVGVALIAKKPIETIERNIEPTQFLLSAVNEKHLSGRPIRLFLASTSEVYGKNPKKIWCEEDDLVFGPTTRARWSYGASKAIDEFLTLGYWRQSKLPCVIGRFFNVVGPRQTGAYGMVLPRFAAAAKENRNLIVHDDGQQTRCFAHVDDVTDGVIRLMETDQAIGQIFNIGSDYPVSIKQLAEKVIEIAGSDSNIEYQSYSEAYDEDFEDIRRRVPDLSKIRNAINFSPKHDLQAIVRDVINNLT
ncbi:MAG: GDP-mannose 4,6-dehydratase [Pirellulaceae bacterium]|nr:GDP-mannose 4,6-dehydratase [Pirellulaceae bacterium]